MQICIVAEHASTHFGGEAFLPLRYFSLLRSRGIDTWLVVHSRTRRELEELFPRDLDRIFFVPDLWIHRLVFTISRALPRRVSEATFGLINQLITQFYQRSIVRNLIRTQPIDVIHQPIPISPRFPSALFSMGIPVVIGPLNGGMEFPEAFRSNESLISRAAVAFLKLFTNAGNNLLPGKKQAAVLLVANERTRNALPRGVRGRVLEMNENGVDTSAFHSGEPDNLVRTNPLFVFVGRLVDWKAVDIAIRALARFRALTSRSLAMGRCWRPGRHWLGRWASQNAFAFLAPRPSRNTPLAFENLSDSFSRACMRAGAPSSWKQWPQPSR